MRNLISPSRLIPLILCIFTGFGCVRQDTEILTRVGRKLADKAQASTSGLRDKLPFRITTSAPETPTPTPTLQTHIESRLQTDKLLQQTKIEVVVTGSEVELKGTIETDEKKRRAIDLTESTQGVEKVTDSLQVPSTTP